MCDGSEANEQLMSDSRRFKQLRIDDFIRHNKDDVDTTNRHRVGTDCGSPAHIADRQQVKERKKRKKKKKDDDDHVLDKMMWISFMETCSLLGVGMTDEACSRKLADLWNDYQDCSIRGDHGLW